MRHLRWIPLLILLTCTQATQQKRLSYEAIEENRLKITEEIERSVLKVTCSTYYRNYYFSFPENVSEPFDQDALLTQRNMSTSSVAGTGLIIYQDNRRQLILTCHHVFDFPDTLDSYYLDANILKTPYLNTRSVKYGQNILVFHKNAKSSKAEIVAMDKANDLALIETSLDAFTLTELPFKGSFISGDQIRLGQEIYLIGFPKGFLMVTRGLASPSRIRNKFMVDAPFNRGFSGGVVLVFDYDTQNFHIAGIANSIAYNSETVLAPSSEVTLNEDIQKIPYQGHVYPKELKLLNYGVTYVIKSDYIVEFLNNQKELLEERGYNSSNLSF